MKKSVLALLTVMVFAATISVASAKTAVTSSETARAIRFYKAGNYTEAYVSFKEIVKKDPSNGLAYYYLGMSSTQLGRREEALENYDKAIALSPNGILGKYAKTGKRCIELPTKCRVDDDSDWSEEDKFIKGRTKYTNEARSVHEKEKLENLKREINRNQDISPRDFREYKDFSSQAPTNDEIVNAIRTLQRAGISTNNDVYGIIGSHNGNSEYDILNALFAKGDSSAQNLSPQLIKSLLSTQMTSSF